jgi:uncharacterized protein (UPF0261 family)
VENTPPSERQVREEPTDRRLFPYNSVVGVIDDPSDLEAAVEGLVASGFAESDVNVLCGERGVRQIDAKGKRKGLLARLFRTVDALGAEREHTEHHVAELEAGHFIVVVDSPDDAAKLRARDGLAAHGGHFINYYSRFSAENL